MGFYMYIAFELPVSPVTGLPLHRVCCVPYRFRPFVEQRNPILKMYIPGETDGMNACPQEFLDVYPGWLEVVEEVVCQGSSWSEADHDLFREALVWFASKDYFRIHWSY